MMQVPESQSITTLNRKLESQITDDLESVFSWEVSTESHQSLAEIIFSQKKEKERWNWMRSEYDRKIMKLNFIKQMRAVFVFHFDSLP